VQLESLLHPPELCLTLAKWRKNFQDIESNNCNFSWGLFDKNKLVGYLIAHLDSSFQENSDEDVITVDDMVVQTEYKKHLFSLIKAFVDELRKRNINHLPIETISTEEAFLMLEKHQDLWLDLGYKIARTYPIVEEGKNWVWVRFEPEQD